MKLPGLLRSLAIVAAAALLACACGKDPVPGEDLPSGHLYELVEGSATTYTIPDIISEQLARFDIQVDPALLIQFLPLLGINGLDGLAGIAKDNTPYGTENIIYRTQDPLGKEIWASGRLYYPIDGNGNMAKPKHILLSSHHTIGSNDECPTEYISYEAGYASNGGLVVCPDYIGYGNTKGLPHPYCIPDITARVNTDMLRAARKYLADRGFGEIADKIDIYNIGYSQGGHAALATLRYIETDKALSKEFGTLKRTCCGAGPYDVSAMLESYSETDRCSLPAAIVMMTEGCRWIFAELAGGDDSKWYSKAVIDAGIKQMVLGKNYSLDKLNTAVHNACKGSFKAIFADWNTQKALLETAARECSITGDWKPGTPVHFYHAPNDDTVPYFNLTSARTTLSNANTTFEDGMDVPQMLSSTGIGIHTFNGIIFFARNICGEYLNK